MEYSRKIYSLMYFKFSFLYQYGEELNNSIVVVVMLASTFHCVCGFVWLNVHNLIFTFLFTCEFVWLNVHNLMFTFLFTFLTHLCMLI
jgi:hypothetical protein